VLVKARAVSNAAAARRQPLVEGVSRRLVTREVRVQFRGDRLEQVEPSQVGGLEGTDDRGAPGVAVPHRPIDVRERGDAPFDEIYTL
jgi:hypothetical protein